MKTAKSNRAGIVYVAAGLIATSQPIFLPGDTLTLGVLGAMALVALWMVLVHGRRLMVPIPLLLFIFWAVVSVGWSASVSTSVNATLTLVFVTIIACKCATFEAPVILRGLQHGGVLVLLMSLALAYMRPSQGLVTHFYNTGALQGVYSHRNTLAVVLAVALAAVLCRLAAGDGKRWLVLAALGFLGMGIIATQSSSGLAASAVAVLVTTAVAVARRVGRVGRVFIGLAAVIIVLSAPLWVSPLFGRVTTALGRDVTLTGRTYIWEAAGTWLQQSPLTGYGWGGVWADGSLVGDSIRLSFGSDSASSAHNGFLDIVLHLGFIGLALYVCVLLPAITRSIRIAMAGPMNYWPIVMLGIFVAYNMVESRAVRPSGEFIIALVAGAVLNTLLLARTAEDTGKNGRLSRPQSQRSVALRPG